MALTDVQHVEAVALINGLLDNGPSIPPEIRVGAEGWLAEHHPPPSAYSAAMRSLAGGDEEERLTIAEAFDRAQPGNPGDVGLVMGLAGVRDEAELKLALRKVEEEGHKAALRIGRPPYGAVAAEAFCAGAIWKAAQRG